MKFTKYFQFRRLLPDREAIEDAWIRAVVENPSRRALQGDGRIMLWGKVTAAGGRFWAVPGVLTESGRGSNLEGITSERSP